jgi:hypothetical protein
VAIRFLHKGWKLFWKVVLSLALIILIIGGGGFALLQLDATQDVIIEKIENDFGKNYNGTISIGELDGLLPFNATLNNVVLTDASADSVPPDTLARIEQVEAGIDVWGLFQKRLTIDAFSLKNPSIRLLADGSGSYTLGSAIKKKKLPPTDDQSSSSWFKDVEIVAPQLSIKNGSVFIEKFYAMSPDVQLPEPMTMNSINAQMFVELTGRQRFVDAENFSANINDVEAGNLKFSGQLYNDDKVLEFNSFHLTAGTSHLHLNGAIEGVDLYKGAIRTQLAEADYDIEFSSHRLKVSEFRDVLTDLPNIKEPLDFSIQTEGKINNLTLNSFQLGLGESYFAIDGEVNNLFKDRQQLAYNFAIDTLRLREQDAEILFDSLTTRQYRALENLRLNGQASGSNDSLVVDVNGDSPLGSFSINGRSQLVEPYTYSGSVTGRGVNIGPFLEGNIDTTRLNFTANVSGQNTSLTTGSMRFMGSASNSFINHLQIDSLRFTTSLQQGIMEANYFYRNDRQYISGSGSANFNRDDPALTLNGNTENLNVATLFENSPIDTTSLNTNYEIDMQGLQPDRIQGMARFEVEKSVIGGDSVRAHQIAVNLDSPDQQSRTLQVNSSLFDLTLTGNLKPSNISNQYAYWSQYFDERIAEEVKLDSVSFTPEIRPFAVDSLQLRGDLTTKDLLLVQQYLPEFPAIESNSTINFNLSGDAADLQFSANINSDTLTVNTVQAKDASTRLSGHFKHDKTLKEFSSLDFDTDIARMETNFLEMDSLGVSFNYARDSLYYSQKIGQFSDNARFNLDMRSALSKNEITVSIDNFFLGNPRYAWQNEGTPEFTFNKAKEIIFDEFQFQNQTEYFALQGRLSPNPSDSLQYIIRDVNLGRISDLITGQFDFSGRLNGTLQTRSLTRRPSIQGDLSVNKLQIENRTVGDVSFTSSFNEEQNRFDTKLKVLTDSTKYREYIAANEGIGQNIVLDGYFIPSDIETNQDSVFYFDADFNEVDMWAMQLITQNIFSQLEGSASGTGYISGNLQDVNFNADFQLDEVYARPQFLNTNYYLDGHLAVNNKQGVVLDNIDITDREGGTGMVTGTVDLNDFKPITFLDLRMEMNDLAFLDNSYSPDVPFYGSLSGTGTIRLSGANTDMQLRSINDIRVSQNSTLSIPLLAQTELNASNSFIEFVDSFENPEKQDIGLTADGVANLNIGENELEQAIDQLTFSERFNIDLQFNAPEPIDVRLIFDPVTGEIMRARGTGRLRITMQQGDVQMFGNYAVTGGSYNFVSGEIFSRELDIRPGGSILWEGPPDNARLDIDAVYHARPTVSSLVNTSGDTGPGGGAPDRIPVDLIVEISGTLTSVENDFYFEVPNNFELSSNPTVQITLNQINRDEQQKLLQATSVLLTGNFLPSSTGAGGNTQRGQLGQALGNSSTYLNPLLSNQVISPLLSNQINSLLNSDATKFDIDFNLNEYNEIDLGIALRLYNDKLIFRREGYLTGGAANSSFGERIGDLNATYRINNNLSLTAFHRQDQTFSTLGLSPANRNIDFRPSVNGVGVEAQVRFNTWQQLSHKVQNFFRRLVGKDEVDYEQQEREDEREKLSEQTN